MPKCLILIFQVNFANDLHVTIVARIVEGIIISLTYHCLCIGRFNDE